MTVHTLRTRTRGLNQCLMIGLMGLLMTSLALTARSDDFIDRANAKLPDSLPDARSDIVLLPVMAAIDAPPSVCDTPQRAMLLDTTSTGWAQASEWAAGEHQIPLFAALKQVTLEDDYRKAFVFVQPYGAQGAGFEMLKIGMYTELGDPPLLAAAQHLYLPAFDNAASLVHVQATKLASEKKVFEAIDLLVDWLFFCRQIADRAFQEEVTWSYLSMIDALERIRDIAYLDYRYGEQDLDATRVPALIQRLDPERGYLNFDHLVFPGAERVAVEQLVSIIYEPRGGPNPNTFARTMARLGSTDLPLRLFSEASSWRSLQAFQADWFDATAETQRVFDDFESRWDVDYFDSRMSDTFTLHQLNPFRYAALRGGIYDMSPLYQIRQRLRVEAAGTRTALAVVAYVSSRGAFPPSLSAVRPRYVKRLDVDPYNPNRLGGARPPMEYFVPNKINYRQTGPREAIQPHEMNVVTGDRNFKLSIEDDQFVIYSVGRDGGKNIAAIVQNSDELAAGTDYLIWPPLLSLRRQDLEDQTGGE